MAHSYFAGKTAKIKPVQVVIGLEELRVVEAYRKAAQLSSRAKAVQALVDKGLQSSEADQLKSLSYMPPAIGRCGHADQTSI